MDFRSGSRTAATSKTECFVIIVNGFQPLTIITKHSILDVAAALDPPMDLAMSLLFKFWARFNWWLVKLAAGIVALVESIQRHI